MLQADSGITYIWPMTTSGVTANFTCPLSSDAVVTRHCGITGWEPFDDEGCGNSNEVSSQLNKAFNNVHAEKWEILTALKFSLFSRINLLP